MRINAMEAPILTHSSKELGIPSEKCIHCGNPLNEIKNSQFCCHGCETVYYWIQDHHLERYYDLKEKGRSIRKVNPISDFQDTFNYLDSSEVLETYSWQTQDGRWMDFYLEGVHCAACVWLTEKLPELVDHVEFIRLNLGSSVATVRVSKDGSFAAVANELQKMGYRPHPVKRGQEKELQKRENRLLLMQVGVAGAVSGNIMLLAISLYGGATGVMAERFQWISFFLFLPVMFFSALPFYKSAWKAIQLKTLSIDIPIVFGIGLGSIVSVVNLLSGDDRVYFDSLSTLVFLLLSTRYLLKRTQQVALDSSKLHHFLVPSLVKKWNAKLNEFEEVTIDRLMVGDRVQVLAGEPIPVDGIIQRGNSFLDCAVLTGEAQPEKVGRGSIVFAGTVNLDSPIEIEVTQSGAQTRLGRFFTSMERLLSRKDSITLFADRVSRYFVAATLLLSGLLIFWRVDSNWRENLNRILAISIVTCPCTFGLITPLAFSLILGKLAKCGLLVKGPDVIEKLAQIKTVFFDKTGTLTYGKLQVVSWEVPQDLETKILAIESRSNHQVAKAIKRYFYSRKLGSLPEVKEIKETIGLGIRARIDEDWIEIRRATSEESDLKQSKNQGTEVAILKNDQWVGRIVLSDQVRPEAKHLITSLSSLGLKSWILSGDRKKTVDEVAEALDIHSPYRIYEASPEQKCEVLRENPFSLLAGDGANDAMALAQAYVGVSVQGGVEISMRAADVYIGTPGIQSIYSLIVIARETLRVVRRNLYFSIIYNFVAIGFAIAGKINPLFAAILMPLSAFTVFMSTFIGTPSLRRAFEGINK